MASGIKPATLDPAVVAVPGTAVPLSADPVEFQSLLLQADPDNTGNVYLGDSTVDDENGIALEPGEKLGIDGLRRDPGNDSGFLNEWYVDADTADNAVRIVNLIRR